MFRLFDLQLSGEREGPIDGWSVHLSWRGWFGLGGQVSAYHWFSDEEVAKWGLQGEMWAMLDMARNKSGVPYIITSGKRTPDQEAALHGGVSDSSHITGWGVDLSVQDGHTLALVMIGLTSAGFQRFGIYWDSQNNPTHIHVDADPALLARTGPVMWLKPEQNA